MAPTPSAGYASSGSDSSNDNRDFAQQCKRGVAHGLCDNAGIATIGSPFIGRGTREIGQLAQIEV